MNEIIPTLQTVTLSLDSGIARITLNRPDKLNALNDEMWRELREAFTWADSTSAARVVILSGNGRAFSTGIDLAMLAGLRERIRHADLARSQELLRALILDLQDCVSSIERCRKPVIAAIHGPCIGGAVDIISACDMRYASANAIFSVREIDIGMAADVGTLQRLPRIIPDGIARELAYTGRNVLAEEAKEFGLVNRVFDTPDQLLEGVGEVAATVAAKSPLAIRGVKEMLNYGRDHSVEDGLRYVATWNASALLSEDLQESVAAMMQKRAPSYRD
ncbi:crotonase/enoyl-CoA hydratase family protein [Niveibacterium microcysteis]|uniref:Crotonase/enoyl-CoA hydratase family protein n=1 Tax=Niveibacterium microcysteis TaxID=2811415 RepID=A0ABX7MDE4_9RHOO|nr:crotonase/enoyl-CoA hydratase family protein [Niveibacterium microcysteis]QSI78913.1 crotonase/enoyl-CoA hydratase family protein [Niveibacterium microcysteis]